MKSSVIIRPAVMEDLEAISRLRTEAILYSERKGYSQSQLQQWANVNPASRTRERIRHGCVLLATSGSRIVGSNSLDLNQREMLSLFVSPQSQNQHVGTRLVERIEQLAVQYGILDLRVEAAEPAIRFYEFCHYQPRPGATIQPDPRTGLDSLSMHRSLAHRQTRYGARITMLLEKIGIDENYGSRHKLRLQEECRELATVGIDNFGREQLMSPGAAMAWYRLREAAAEEEIKLQLISAFRSVGRQVSIIERKRQAGQSMSEILKSSAAPGFSEHHTGAAIDLATPGCPPLHEGFETTAAFEWLTESAGKFGFRLSYPRNNAHNLAYEPWHWKFTA